MIPESFLVALLAMHSNNLVRQINSGRAWLSSRQIRQQNSFSGLRRGPRRDKTQPIKRALKRTKKNTASLHRSENEMAMQTKMAMIENKRRYANTCC